MLVPKLRFKREDGTEYPEWSNQRFSNAFTPLNNNTFSRDMLSESGSVCNIHYGDILVKYGEVCDIQKENTPKVNNDIDTGKYDLLQDGDIILADTAEDETVGKAIEIYHIGTSKVVSGLHTMACRPNDKYAPKYMGYYINSPTYHNQLLPFMQGIKVTSIGRRNISDTVIYYPADMEEQQKIADFLSTVDEVIAQSEAEVQNLEQQKKAAMQKIFSQEVRFKREDGSEYPEWRTTQLSTYLFENKDRNINNDYGKQDVLSVSGEFGVVNQIEFQGRSFAGADVSLYHILYSGDIVYTKSPLKANPYGIIKYNQGVTGIVSTLYAVYHCKSNVDGRFIEYYFDDDLILNKYLKPLVNIGSKHDMKINNEYALSGNVCFPCLEEQQKIADFLSAYDEAISYAKQELDKWKELKKGLLQQMFV